MTDEELNVIEASAYEGVLGIQSEGGGPSGAALRTCDIDVLKLTAEVRRLRAENASLREAIRAKDEALLALDEHSGGHPSTCWDGPNRPPGSIAHAPCTCGYEEISKQVQAALEVKP